MACKQVYWAAGEGLGCSPGSLAVLWALNPISAPPGPNCRECRGAGPLVTEEHQGRGSQHCQGQGAEDKPQAGQAPLPEVAGVRGPVPCVHKALCVSVCVSKVPPGPLGHTLVTQGYGMYPAQPAGEQSHQFRASASRLSHRQTHPGRCPPASQACPTPRDLLWRAEEPLTLTREGAG